MRTILLLLLLASPVFLSSCKKDENSAPVTKEIKLSQKQKQVINTSNSFGFDFFRKAYALSGENGNMMVSPLSVSMAFGMARNGAGGTTLDDMSNSLGFEGMSETDINESYKYILETFSALDPKVNVSIANSIWIRDNFPVEQQFISTNQNYFQAEANSVDFANPATLSTINGWVSDKTNKLIPKIIDQISDDMVMYLINAVYFKGQWKYSFDAKNTANHSFTLEDGSISETPFMIQRCDLNYFKGADFSAVELPYNQGNYNMVVMLPDAGKTVNDLVSELSLENWNSWYSRFAKADVQIQLPKFKFEYEEEKMIPIMTDLGMGVAFNPNEADFSRINSNADLYISEVRHKTFIETNEAGSEAAAVTSIGIAVTTVGVDPEPINFVANRPFVFFINEKSTGSILFIGTITEPATE